MFPPSIKLPVGHRSAAMIADGSKRSMIVSLAQRPAAAEARPGSLLYLPRTTIDRGYFYARCTAACFHDRLATIPACEAGHEAARVDPEADWATVIIKAAQGGPRPASAERMDALAASGWVWVDFEPEGGLRPHGGNGRSAAKRARRAARAASAECASIVD